MDLSNIKRPEGARKNRKRVGRGHASGWGKTSGKGHKGQNARTGGGVPAHFEGGQMPLARRLPKFGFTNLTRKNYQIVNIGRLNAFNDGDVVDFKSLKEKGFVSGKKGVLLKILGNGSLEKSLKVEVNSISSSAKMAIEKAGGTVTTLKPQEKIEKSA